MKPKGKDVIASQVKNGPANKPNVILNNSYKTVNISPLKFYRCAIIITGDQILHS
jgi:hypothetical protein